MSRASLLPCFFLPRLDLPRGRSWPSSSPCSWFRAMASVAWLSKPVRRRKPNLFLETWNNQPSFQFLMIIYIYICHIYCCWWFDWWTLFVFVGGIKNWIFGGFLMSAEWCRGLNDHSSIVFFVAAQLQQFGLVCDARNQEAVVNYVQQTTDINYKRYNYKLSFYLDCTLPDSLMHKISRRHHDSFEGLERRSSKACICPSGDTAMALRGGKLDVQQMTS